MSQPFEPPDLRKQAQSNFSTKPASLSLDTLERITQESRTIFLQEEAPELLKTLVQGFERLKTGNLSHQDQEYLTLIRAAHSFKGGASMAQLPTLIQLAHKLEDVLEIFKNQSFSEPALMAELLKHTASVMEKLMVQEPIEKGEATSESGLLPTFQRDSLSSLIPIKTLKEQLKSAQIPILDLIHLLEEIHQENPANEQNLKPKISSPSTNLSEDLVTESSFTASKEVDLNINYQEKKTPDSSASLERHTTAGSEKKTSKIPERFLQYIVIQPKNIIKKPHLSVRMPVASLDRMSNTIGELLVSHEKLSLHHSQLHQSHQNLKTQTQRLLPIQDHIYLLLKQLTEYAHSDNPLNQTEMAIQLKTNLITHLRELQELIMQVQESKGDVDVIVREQQNTLDQLRSSLDALNQDLRESRLVPFKGLTERFRASIAQLNQQYYKSVELVIQGAEIMIDQAILQQLQTPINHLVRNAFDHGIEQPAERQALGKNLTAKITLSAAIQGNDLVIKVADDGRGIDLKKVYQRALENGFIQADSAVSSQGITPQFSSKNNQTSSDYPLLKNSPTATTPQSNRFEYPGLSQAEILEFLFTPGFSTAATVNDLSGRGVGLDVVRYEVGQLRGTMQVETQLGVGTQFIITIPLALSVVRLLLCRCGQQLLAIPATNVLEVISLSDISPSEFYKTSANYNDGISSEIRSDQENLTERIFWKNRLISWFPLRQLLPYRRQDVISATPVLPASIILILETKGEPIAVGVDALYQERDLVLKSFDSTVSVPAYISGCTVLGTGEVVPVLSPHHFGELIIHFQKSKTAAESQNSPTQSMTICYPQQPPTPSIYASQIPKKEQGVASNLPIPSILVVDDSITVRRSLDYLLSQAGYQITQCSNGKEAIYELHKLGQVFDLVISDLEMPRLNGLALLHEIRNHPHTKHLPVMMLTSRHSERYRRQLFNAGATAFLSKPWNPNQLLESIASLLLSG